MHVRCNLSSSMLKTIIGLEEPQQNHLESISKWITYTTENENIHIACEIKTRQQQRGLLVFPFAVK